MKKIQLTTLEDYNNELLIIELKKIYSEMIDFLQKLHYNTELFNETAYLNRWIEKISEGINCEEIFWCGSFHQKIIYEIILKFDHLRTKFESE